MTRMRPRIFYYTPLASKLLRGMLLSDTMCLAVDTEECLEPFKMLPSISSKLPKKKSVTCIKFIFAVVSFYRLTFWSYEENPKKLTFFIVPTFDTKVTEYLCSGWVLFFFRQISTFYLAIFDGIFYIIRKVLLS